MKSMDKDRGRRYDTANALSADLQRYLNDEPIIARPPTVGYRLGKFTKRNRGLVLSCSIASIALLIGLITAVGFGIKAGREAKEAMEARKLAEATLKNYHTLLIESVLFHAASGDIEKVRTTIASMDDASFPEDWKRTLEGVAYLHRGDNLKAIEVLEQGFRSNEDSVSAKAMLSLAYFHTGRWNDWVKLAADVSDDVPRKGLFREYDEFFLAYAWFYSNPDKSETQLESIVEKHRTWIIPCALLANLKGHQALFYEQEGIAHRKRRMNEALHLARTIPQELIFDNPFLLVHTLFTYSAATRILDDDSGALAAEAHRLAECLAKHPKYMVGAVVRGSFYVTVHQNRCRRGG